MILDERLSMRDEGLSAYHQRHVKRGALGTFLAAVEDGLVPAGSVLIVEGLDRLSRAEPIQAQAQLAQIISAGITVVTASDGREYNRETLKAQPMDLVYSLLVMIRAFEESDTKSKRVKAAIRRMCEGWQAGTYRGIIRNGGEPDWLRWDGERWHLVPERVEAMRLAISLFLDGYGAMRIIQELARRGLQMTDSGNIESYFYRALRLRPLIGEKVLSVDGTTYHLSGYYPPIITQDEFDRIQTDLDSRRRHHGKGDIPGIVTGLSITHCGYCGAPMTAQNWTGRKRRADGSPQPSHRRLICMSYSSKAMGRGKEHQHCGSCSVVPVEIAVMHYCSDQMNLDALLSRSGTQEPLRAKLIETRRRIADLEAKLERLTEAMLADTEAVPIVFARKAREMESALAGEKVAAEALERELRMTTPAHHPEAAEAWQAVAEAAARLNHEARMKARKLVADTFERIVIYHRGTMPDESDGKTIDLLLIPKGGRARALRVDRKTGAWRAGEEWDVPASDFGAMT